MIKMPPVQYDIVQCKGGWDQLTPTLSLKAGYLRDILNFECSASGGYSRIGGYERYDGQAKPSDALYTTIQVASFTNTPTVGQTLTGFTSSATGVIIALGANYIIITNKVGTYTVGETVKVGATVIGTTEAVTASITGSLDAQYLNLAADQYRADILEVPGSGPVRGVAVYSNVVYAFRNNAGGTAVDMYKSTSSGWAQVAFEYEVSFTNANINVTDGDTITQGGVTATIRRVVVQSGTLLSGVNSGRLVISVTAGGNLAAGAATTTGSGALTISGAQTAITMAVGGRFEFDQYNFFGNQGGLRLYGCDGINRMFEFDGTYFVPIATGSTPDTPKHLKCFQDHLHVLIASTNLHSGISNPYNWTPRAGASYKALGDTLTGYAVQPGTGVSGAMVIFGRNNTYILYGTSAGDWQYDTYAEGVGARDYSAQLIGGTYFLDDRGVTNLAASQNFGNFDQSTITNNIRTFINSKRNLVSYSSISRERSQYRLFFSDGYALYATIVNGKVIGLAQVKFDSAVYCACEGELSDGSEALFYGSASDGYVFQLDKGTSFDGGAITAYITFNWNHSGSPRMLKRYRRASIEMQGDGYSEISLGYSLAYGSANEIQPNPATYSSSFAPAYWDSFTWDSFTWDGVSLSPTECEIGGTGENIQIGISSALDYLAPYTINTLILHYTPRRALR
jgi:hypothetical protein